jgi:ABC-type transport system involved in cytochrome c biogenesis permease subunit
MRLYINVTRYVSLTSSFQFAVPHDDFSIRSKSLASAMGLRSAPEKHSFFDIAENAEKLTVFLDGPHDTAQQMNEDGKEASRLYRALSQWLKFYTNMPVPILPVSEHGSELWGSPWDVLQNPNLMKSFTTELTALSRLTRAYLYADQKGFNDACAAFEKAVKRHIRENGLSEKISMELKYNKFGLFRWSGILYGFSLLIALSALVVWRKLLSRIALLLLVAALVPHSLGMLLRMLIMDRPPITNLYETFLFVGWMGAVLGLVIEALQRRTTGIITAAFTGLAMLLIAEKYALEGDTMGMLVAVLDSNFWLATHVITITMGYAGCCAAGVIGHVYLLQELFIKNREKLTDTGRTVYGVMAFGWIFSFIGTVLGGIWADQSWGRFWGWDPKENGALLIVLWCSILFHARLGGMIKNLGLAIGSVIGVVVVMFAWFGVNLLGVGLHSYGFSSGAGRNLLLYTVFETVFLLVCVWFILQKKYRVGIIKKLEKE